MTLPERRLRLWRLPPNRVARVYRGGVLLERFRGAAAPSDSDRPGFSVVAEARDVPVDTADAHLGLGWDVALDAFDGAGHHDAWVPGLRRDGPEGPRSRARRLAVEGDGRPRLGARSLVGVVTGGAGRIRAGSGDLAVRGGETFAVPAAPPATLRSKPNRPWRSSPARASWRRP